MKKTVLLFAAAILCMVFCLNAQTDSIDVTHYGINLNIDNIIPKGHTGYTDITFNYVTRQYNRAEFSLKRQMVDSVYVSNQSVNTPAQKAAFTVKGDKVQVDMPQYATDSFYTVRIYYHGASTVEQNMYAWGGLHYESNIIYSMGVAFMDYPHSYARSWFAVHESFTDKATYDLYISVGKDKEAVCSGKLISKTEQADFDTYHYRLEQNVSPYLVAVTVADFYTFTKTVHSDTYNYDIPLVVKYVYKEDSAGIAHNFDKIDKAFNTMEQHFGRYRFNRLGYCVTPIGSMEHVDNISLARGAVTDTGIDAVGTIVHEMGHSWFGNLATCQTAEDMWLNEGWTTYSTRQSLEAIYGKERVSDYWNEKHFAVLNSLPHKEGVRAVTPVDSSLTYSSTVYEKGAMVVTTLEAYFPQGVFFDAVKAMLDSFQYKNYNSYQVRDFIATYTQDEGFKDFFNRLVFEDKQINYDVYRSADGGIHTVLYPEEYDGQLAVPVKEVNQKLFTDTDRRLAVLTTSHCTQISTVGEYDMPTVYGKVKLKTASEPSDWQTVLHWVGPSADSLPQGVEKISSVHYWTVQYDGLTSEDAELKFYFELSDNIYSFDSSLVSGFDGKDSVMLLYRKDCKSPWQRVGMSEIKDFKGYAATQFVACGDYVFAKGDKSKVSIDLTDFNADAVKIYPNPSSDKVNIVVSDRNITKVNVYSQEGKLICRQKIHSDSQTLCGIPQGSYVFEFVSGKQRISKQVIIK